MTVVSSCFIIYLQIPRSPSNDAFQVRIIYTNRSKNPNYRIASHLHRISKRASSVNVTKSRSQSTCVPSTVTLIHSSQSSLVYKLRFVCVVRGWRCCTLYMLCCLGFFSSALCIKHQGFHVLKQHFENEEVILQH